MPVNKEGRAAFHRGKSTQDVPYSDTRRRIQWIKGWCDSKQDYTDALEKRQLNGAARRGGGA